MKISEITIPTVKEYLRIYEDDGGIVENIIMPAARRHLADYVGLSETEIDDKPDLAIAYLVLIAHLYENRTMTVEKDSANRVVESIIEKHAVNLL